MALILGTNVGSAVVPYDDADAYPSHKAIYGLGGLRTVADEAARLAIPLLRQEAGMLVFQEDTASYYKLDVLPGSNPANWTIADFMTPHIITDNDGDTYVDVEKTADDDIVRISTGGTEWLNILTDGSGVLIRGLDGAGVDEAGASITIRGGEGTNGNANSGDVTLETLQSSGSGVTGQVKFAFDGNVFASFFTSDHNDLYIRSYSDGATGSSACVIGIGANVAEDAVAFAIMDDVVGTADTLFSIDGLGQQTISYWATITTTDYGAYNVISSATDGASNSVFNLGARESISAGSLLTIVDDIDDTPDTKFVIGAVGDLTLWTWGTIETFPYGNMILGTTALPDSGRSAFILKAEADWSTATLFALVDDFSGGAPVKFGIRGDGGLNLHNFGQIYPSATLGVEHYSNASSTAGSIAFRFGANSDLAHASSYLMSVGDNAGTVYAQKFAIKYNGVALFQDGDGSEPVMAFEANAGTGFSRATEGRASPLVFTGTGLDDVGVSLGFTFTGAVSTDYVIEIDGGDPANPNTFRWSNDGGATWEATGVPLINGAVPMENGLSAVFSSVTGHVTGDKWEFTAAPEEHITISIDGSEEAYFLNNTFIVHEVQSNVAFLALQGRVYDGTAPAVALGNYFPIVGSSPILTMYDGPVGAVGSSVVAQFTNDGAVRCGVDASEVDFTNAFAIISQSDTGYGPEGNIIGLAVEASAVNAGSSAYSIFGVGRTDGNRYGSGVHGVGIVNNTADTAASYGVSASALDTHAGGFNVAVFASAANGGNNYSFFGILGKLYNLQQGFIGATNETDFSEAQLFVSRGDTGLGYGMRIGVAAEADADGSVSATGVVGVGKTSSTHSGHGGYFAATVDASSNTTDAIGAWCISGTTHASGRNIAVYADANDGNTNYAFYGVNGDIRNSGKEIWVPSTTTTIATDGDITVTRGIMRVVGDGGAATNVGLADGQEDGVVVILQGTSDANSVTITDNRNCQLAGGANMVLGVGDTLMLEWDSGDSNWYELCRSNN